jgi:hypothetical protein
MQATEVLRLAQHTLLKTVYLGLAAVLAVSVYHEYLRLKNQVKGLPGPRGYPIVGNLLQVKGKPAYEIYREWAEEFGPVFQGELPRFYGDSLDE